uniref:Ribosomal protein S8 n=1 Tax=Neotessella volvocina TaxID=52559 RepID=A0A3G2R0C4_9STRA|nr:ribosomal protein S8 [Neotessella volvocina]
MTNDLVSDMLTRLRNASLARHSFTTIKFSKLSLSILKVLQDEGYIKSYETENNSYEIRVILKYKGWWIKKPLFSKLQRISKPGLRVFSGYKDFNKCLDILRYEQGTAIVSTSIGVMSHIKAKNLKKGGEILCYIG